MKKKNYPFSKSPTNDNYGVKSHEQDGYLTQKGFFSRLCKLKYYR